MSITACQVVIADYMPALRDMFLASWDELGFPFDCVPCEDSYRSMQDAGVLFAAIAFSDSQIIGYCTAVITPHPFNTSITFCATDALYILPEFRKGRAFYVLSKEIEREAMQRGARFISWHTKAGTSLAKALRKRGYKDSDVVVVKELSNGN